MYKAGIPLTARLVEAFAGVYLSPMYDNLAPTPAFHRECWELYCSPAHAVAVAAPRGHAKSTALTHNYGLAAALFRFEPHILIVSNTEELAMGQLGDMSKELHENDDLRRDFGVKKFLTDSKGEIIVECDDGYQFRIIARGAGQRLRGMKWNGRRPGLVLCDDMEDDEQVENRERRNKFRRWVMRALMPLRRIGGKIRWHGTIMQEDAMLARLLKDASWVARKYKAHRAYDDFSEILWPGQFAEFHEDPLRSFRSIQRSYITAQDPSGYSQEYLNDPLDLEDAYLQSSWFTPMTERDHDTFKIVCAAADFAISKKDSANRTSLTVGGMDTGNILHFTDQHVGRWDSQEIVDCMFAIQRKHNPDVFWVENGQIWKAIGPMLRKEMLSTGVFINVVPREPISDKASRGRSLQRRMRAGATRWDTEAEWFEGMKDEMLRFTEHAEATLNDQFDSAALLSLGFDEMRVLEEEDSMGEEEEEMVRQDPRNVGGRSKVTGY